MPKYYVSSGDLNITLESDCPDNAAKTAFNKMKDNIIAQLGRLTVVSEHGFNSGRDDDTYYITCDLLNETDQLADFKSAEWAK